MSIVSVDASRTYDVEIQPGLLPSLGEKAAKLVKGRKAAVVSDDTVMALYGKSAVHSLENAGFSVISYVFTHGENSKNGSTYLDLVNTLAENHLTRSDLLVALGGGVVGDLTGFAAATYLRGVSYIQIPTTLLAMVDSSVGGKTAIDLPAGKNLAGAFYQPRYVLCDTDLLCSLPEDFFRDGCAEVIKYGILGSPELFSRLEEVPAKDQLSYIIEASVSMKRDFVRADEFDTGLRQALNLGHTIGHAIEAASDFRLSHGQCVAIGTAMVARAAASFGYCTRETASRIELLLEKYRLPTKTDFPVQTLCAIAAGDKKRQGSTLTLVVPREIGQFELVKIPMEELPRWIEAGM